MYGLLKPVALAPLWAAWQPAATFDKSLSRLVPLDHVIWANTCPDKVISSFFFCATLSTGVQIACPTHLGMNWTIMPDVACSAICDKVISTITVEAMTSYATRDNVIVANMVASSATRYRVDVIIATDAIVSSATHHRVDVIIATDAIVSSITHYRVDVIIVTDAIAHCATCDRVNLIIVVDGMASFPNRDRVNLKITGDMVASCINCDRVDVTSYMSFQTSVYDVEEYPFFMLCSRQSDFLSFNETVKVYGHCLSKYQLVYIIKFIFCWSNHLCSFVSQNMEMLVNYDLTPQQHCQRAHLSLCRSQYYKHDFAIISSAGGLSTNYVVADFVKYSEHIFHWIFLHKYFHKKYARSGEKRSFEIQTSNCLNSLKYKIPDRIGGGQHGASIEKIRTDVINPFVISMPRKFPDIKMCEFVEHLEMSKGLKKYNGSEFVLCNVPLNLLLSCLFQNTRIAIGRKHDIHISRKMTKSEIAEVFKIHDSICEHKYVTVFCPYTQHSSSEQDLKYREMQKSQVKNVSDSKLPKCVEVNVPEHNTFPPDSPDASLRRKIIKSFCDATKPSNFEEAGCAVCGALTLQSDLSDLSSLNIDLSVLNTVGLGFTRKERKYFAEPISELDGPAIDASCHHICISCKNKVAHRQMPKFALARGLWLGQIPDELQQLSFAEKLLIG